MSSDIPDHYVDPPQVQRARTTGGNVAPVAFVHPDVDYVEYLEAGGYPDHSELGLRFAAGQRLAASDVESRAALTAARDVDDDGDEIEAPSGQGPRLPVFPIGPQPQNRR